MTFSRILPLAGVSLLAMTAALQAEDAKKQDEVTTLETVTIINRGRENVVATGGTVVSREELDRLMPTNVSELFSRQSSIAVSGGGGPSKRIHVFGMEQSNLAVTVDGVPQTATSWHHTGSSVVDPVFLKRVEVEAGQSGAGAAISLDSDIARAALDGLREGFGVEPVRIGTGGSIPIVAEFADRNPGAPILLTAVVDPTSRMHSDNESLDLADLGKATLAEALFLQKLV